MDIQTKDGIILRGIPDGTPDDVIKARIEKIRAESTPTPEIAKPTEKPAQKRSFGNELTRQAGITGRYLAEGLAGTAGIVSDPLAATSNMVLGTKIPRLRDATSNILDNMGVPSPENKTERVVGDMSRSLVGGGAFVKGAQVGANAASGVTKAVMEKIAAAPTAQASAAIGAGGGSGLARESGGGAGTQILAGLAGALAPAGVGVGINAIRGIKDFAYPSVGSLGRKAAGDKADDVVNALLKTRSDVPNVNLTAGEASVPANSAEFAAFQKAVSAELPSKFYGPTGIKGQQATARADAVRSFGGTEKQLKDAVDVRNTVSSKNYKDAYSADIKGDAELSKLMKNPYFKDEVGEARKLAEANGISPTKNLTEFLQYVKEGLDSKIQSATNANATAISNSTKSALLDAKANLVSWLGKNNQLYENARLSHIASSKPINQMKVGQEIERALVAPGTSAERSTAFSNKVRQAENTISKATGEPQIKSLTDGQIKVLKAIDADFKRNYDFKELATAGEKSMKERIGIPVVPPTGMFSPMLSLGRSVVNKMLGTGHQIAFRRAAKVMDNPQEMARLMKNSTPSQRKIFETLMAQRMGQAAMTSAQQGER
jgi:hypothetical protein